MRTIIDFHIHSKYSRATSKNFDLEEMVKWSEIKGVDIISCADFTHPAWFKILKENLIEDQLGSGLYQLKNNKSKVRFIISTEVSCIYRQGDKTRRVHLCILAPSLQVAEKINKKLEARGAKLASDGRPILGMSAKDVLNIILEADQNCMMIPAHAWTPWFAVFGSKSGFNSLQECFEDLTPHIKAIETGLSSDPLMNWHLSELDNIVLVSNSDAHSGPKIGREANVMDLDKFSYSEIIEVIKNKDKERFLYTIEFYPEEGMYYYDGHRDCGFSCSPQETSTKYKGVCPKCKKPLTIGVLYQVDKLADRLTNQIQQNKHISYKSIIPLPDIIADYYGVNSGSKKVTNLFEEIIQSAGNEFRVLLDLSKLELNKFMPEVLAEGIIRMRQNRVKIIPGFDGQYGQVEIFSEQERKQSKDNEQTSMFIE
ncbi:MAG: DNA helicase UvrD [Candidatus Komeilibacteria bacterium CG_4_9_14_0_2_um_filter_36_13]|nr:MAG: DNA helicase UvrD [Candidatus Komeilibacteria bacterium CG_4_9_14_0_2_um_filter_36_13]